MNYDEMDLEQLNAAARYHRLTLLTIQADIVPGISADEELELQQQAAMHQAHLNVIDPRRTMAFVEEEATRSEWARKAMGFSPEAWERIRQRIDAGPAASMTALHGGSVESE
jgi:hypothetical protein